MRTPERALQILNHEIYATPGEMGEAMNLAKEALEKQIPKKAVKVPDDDDWLYWHWECPCGRTFWGKYLYCSRCGQKIDWSDEG